MSSTSNRHQRWGALLLLVLAIVAFAAAYRAFERHARTQGPTHLSVQSDQTVWLVVDQALWHLDAQGRLLQGLDMQEVGLPGVPGSLVAHTRHEMYALPQGADAVAVLDAGSGRVRRHIALQWPGDLRPHLNGVASMAVHPDGRMAISLASGHAVTLFDPNGRVIARTAPGTYEVTNGLWWDGEDLWTTDAQGGALLRLKGDTLAVRERITLPSSAVHHFTTVAVPHPRAGIERYAPMATLARMRQDMSTGRVTFFWADGLEKVLDLGAGSQPRDIAWLGNTLLIAEGRDMRLRRFDLDRRAMDDFGDATVTHALNERRTQRDQWRTQYQLWLAAAIVSLVAAMGLVWRSLGSGRSSIAQAPSGHARFLGTPVDGLAHRIRLRMLAYAPVALVLLAPVVARLLTDQLPISLPTHVPERTVWLTALIMWALITVGLSYAWLKYIARRADQEGRLNAQAVLCLLDSHAWSDIALPGEQVRETWLIKRPGQVRWLVLSNRRLLSFALNQGQAQLDASWLRVEIESAALVPPRKLPWWPRQSSGASISGAWLRVRLHDSTVLQGALRSLVTAQRVQAQLTLASTRMQPSHVAQTSSRRA